MDETELQRLHARLLDGDPTASLDLVEGHGPRLLTQLQRKWPRTPRELCEEAVLESLFGYLRAPRSYDPARGTLGRYLFWGAHRDLQNLLAREARQRPPGTASLDRVELAGEGRNETLGERTADPRSDPGRWLDEVDPALLAEIAAALPDERDRRVLDLIVARERRTEVFAALLGLDALPLPEQRRAVKRDKDRVLKRVQRQLKRGHDG